MDIKQLLGINLPIVLASESPRRKKLLEQLGFEFEVIPAYIEEFNHDDLPPVEHVRRLAMAKAEKAAEIYKMSAIFIGADTVVVLDGKILNKPEDSSDAARMLKLLSGKTHIVYTGIGLLNSSSNKRITDVQRTEVTFRHLSDEEISAYIETGSPMDKAGGYGIQDDFGAVFVSDIRGCYYNIVGLPLELLWRRLSEVV